MTATQQRKTTAKANALLFAAVYRLWRGQVRQATADAVWAGRAFSAFRAA